MAADACCSHHHYHLPLHYHHTQHRTGRADLIALLLVVLTIQCWVAMHCWIQQLHCMVLQLDALLEL